MNLREQIIDYKKLEKLSEKYKKASKGADAYNSKIKVLQELSDKLEDRNLTLSVKIEEVDRNNIDKIFETTKRNGLILCLALICTRGGGKPRQSP